MAFRNRIREFRTVRAGELVPHPQNFRLHPQRQEDELRALLAEVGKVDILRGVELSDGRVGIIDGHLRSDLDPNEEWEVAILDLDEKEQRKVLLAFDRLGALAETDGARLEELADQVEDLSGTAWTVEEIRDEGPPQPPDDFPEYDENIDVSGIKTATCPECGHEFPV